MNKYGGSNIINMYVLKAFEKFATDGGISFYKDPVSGMFLVLRTAAGNRFVITSSPFNINRSGPVRLCNNKAACSDYLAAQGYSVPKQSCFTRTKKGDAGAERFLGAVQSFMKANGFFYPVIVKPNTLSQGTGVCKLRCDVDCTAYFAQSEELGCRYFVIQEFVKAADFRIVVLGDRILQAYQRVPFSVTGNGNNCIRELIEAKTKSFESYGRDRAVLATDDPRTDINLSEQGYTMASVPSEGETVVLQDVSNLSLGGEAVDLSESISPFFKALALDIAKSLGLTLCGIDLFAQDITADGGEYRIIEVNSAPGLDNYAFTKEIEEQYVEGLYKQVFDYIINNL